MFLIRKIFSASNIPTQQAAELPSQLQEVSERLFSELQACQSAAERLETRLKIGKEILEKGKNWAVTDWRSFALFHNASMIGHSSFEGGFTLNAARSWLRWLGQLKCGQAHFFHCPLKEADIERLEQALKSFIRLHQIIPSAVNAPLGRAEVEELARRLRQGILAELAPGHPVYLPTGYRYGVNAQGHALPCKFEDNGPLITVHFLNSGDGAELHPTIGCSTYQEQTSYRYFPIDIPRDVFEGKLGMIALCQVVRYLSDPPDPKQARYVGADLYGIFQTLGTLRAELTASPELLASKLQRDGNCGAKAVRAVAREELIELGYGTDVTRAAFLNTRLCSLLAAYHDCRRRPVREHRVLLNDAIAQFGLAVLKLEGKISQEELSVASAVVEALKYYSCCSQLPKIYSEPDTVISHKELKTTLPLVDLSVRVQKAIVQEPAQVKPDATAELAADSLQGQLKQALVMLTKMPDAKARFDCAYSFVLRLPLPVWEKAGPWQQIPTAQIPQLINDLRQLLQQALNGASLGGENCVATFSELALLACSCMVIADALARRLPECKLEGFASPYLPHVYPKLDPQDITNIPYGPEHARYSLLVEYFELSAKAAKQRIIFPVAPKINLADLVHASTHGARRHIDQQQLSHLLYLQGFLHERFPHHNSQLLEPLYRSLWLDEDRSLLPRPVHDLYDMALMAQCLYSVDSLQTLPTQLTLSYAGSELRMNEDQPDIFKGLDSKFNGNARFNHFWMLRENEIDNRFLPVFSGQLRRLSTNEAVTARLSEEDARSYRISEATYRQLLRITRSRELQVPLALQFASSHLVDLRHEGIRSLVECCLFSPHGVAKRLRREPSQIGSMRAFITKGLDYYRHNRSHLTCILFLLRTGISFELVQREIHKQDSQGLEALERYLDHLSLLAEQDMSSYELATVDLHRAYALLARGLRPGKDLELALTTLFALTQDSSPLAKNDTWLLGKLQREWRHQLPQLHAQLSPSQLSQLAKVIYTRLIKKPDHSLNWTCDYPLLRAGHYELNLETLCLQNTKKGKLLDGSARIFPYNNTVVQHIVEQHPGLFWRKGDVTISADGRLELEWIKGKLQLRRKLSYCGQDRWFVLSLPDVTTIDELGLDFLYHEHELPLAHYAPLQPRTGDPTVITCDARKATPYFAIDAYKAGMCIQRVDEQGQPLPIQLIRAGNGDYPKGHPIYEVTERICHAPDVLCFVNVHTREIEELRYYKLRLNFKRTEGGLESTEYPGFFFRPKLRCSELNNYEGALVLENAHGMRKVVLPALHLEPVHKDFSSEVRPKKSPMLSQRHLIFTVDPLEKSLKSEDPSSLLYVALLLKMQRDYKRALRYLKQVPRNGQSYEGVDTVVSQFRDLRDGSAASKGFNAKLAVYVVANQHCMIERCFSETNYLWSYWSDHEWIPRAYTAYLHTLSRPDRSACPRFLRLTNLEERNMLQMLERRYKKRGQDLPMLIQIRYDLVFKKSRSTQLTVEGKELSTKPRCYELICTPKQLRYLSASSDKIGQLPDHADDVDLNIRDYPVRCSLEAVRYHFVELYERARRSPANDRCEFDFMLPALLKATDRWNHGGTRMLASLLFYVRHCPYIFQDPKYDLQKAEDQASAFDRIVQAVVSLERDPRFATWKAQRAEAKVTFEYERTVTLKEPAPEPPSPLNKESGNYLHQKRPLALLANRLFVRADEPFERPHKAPYLDPSLQRPGLESAIDRSYTEGWQALGDLSYPRYKLLKDQVPHAAKELKALMAAMESRLTNERISILQELNEHSAAKQAGLSRALLHAELNAQLLKNSEQLYLVNLDDVMQRCVLSYDRSFLKQHCPLMSDAQIDEICGRVKAHFHLRAQFDTAKQAQALIDKIQAKPEKLSYHERLAALLDYSFDYDPQDYPEISYFKVMNGKLPRKEQLAIYFWVCEGLEIGENRLYQGHAGLGKTSYIEPLLALRAKKYGLSPVYLCHQEIYPIDKVNLSKTLSSLEQGLGLLEVGMHMRLTKEQYRFIYYQMSLYHREGKGMMLTPQIYYAIHMAYLHAVLIEQDEEKVKWLGLIRLHLKKNCLLLADESHKTLNALTRAIYGTGAFRTLPAHERELFVELMKPLVGVVELRLEDRRHVADVTRLRGNLLGAPCESDLQKVKCALAKYMLAKLNLAAEHHEDFLHYWTDRSAAEPGYLRDVISKRNRDLADRCALVSYFLNELLEEIIKMRTEFDHGRSIYPDEEFDIPYHQRTPSTAQFDDPYRALSASVKGTHHRGLSLDQVRWLIEGLVKDDWAQHGQTFSETESRQVDLFRSFVEGSSLSDKHLRDICFSDEKQLQELHKHMGKAPQVLEHYLKEHILPGVGESPEQFVLTPAHLVGAFKQVCAFSATPLLPITYPTAIGSFRLDPSFEAQVATEYSRSENQGQVHPEEPGQFFDFMQQDPARAHILREASVFQDPGGYFCDFGNQEIARRWLDAAPELDGVLFFKDARSLRVDRHECICLLSRDGQMLELEGSDVKQALKKHSLKWGKLNLATYYDAAHVESADVPQKPGAKCLLFVTDSTTGTRIAQAILRVRGFRDPANQHALTWVIPAAVKPKIKLGASRQLDGAAIYAWSRGNDAIDLKNRAILSAFQEISYLVSLEVEAELEEAMKDLDCGPARQIAIADQHRAGFITRQEHSPYERFSKHEQQVATRAVLSAYAESEYARFGYKTALDERHDLKAAIDKVIIQTEAVIETIATNFDDKVGKQVEQHCMVKKQTERIQYRPRPVEPLSADGEYGDIGIDDHRFPVTPRTPVRHLFDSNHFSERFFLCKNQVITARNYDQALGVDFLKPIDFLLIIWHEGTVEARAQSNHIIASDIVDLARCKLTPELPHRAMLLTADGAICQLGNGALRPSEEQVQEVMRSAWLQDVISDAALLRGEIRYPERLKERIKTWPKFTALFERIAKAQPNPETVNVSAMSKLLEELGMHLSINST